MRLRSWLVAIPMLACRVDQPTRPLVADRIPASQTVAIVHATVLPMTDGVPMLLDQTVIVRDGLIVSVGAASESAVPDGATVIDATGRYLIPGLIDSHTHIRYVRDLFGYLAGGVTTVITLGQSPSVPAMRARTSVEAGVVPGPRIFAALFLDGPGTFAPQPDAAAVRSAVTNARAGGYDLVKIYNGLTPEQFDAAASEATKAGLPIFGHAVRSIPLPYALTHGQEVVAHAEEYLYTALGNQENDAAIPEVVRWTKASGARLIPNLSAYDMMAEQWGRPSWIDRLESDPAFALLDPGWQASWRNSDYVRRPGSLGTKPQFLRRLVAAMAAGGVPLMAGTDSPTIPGVYPGASLAYELWTLVDAGLSTADALRAATRTPGDFLHERKLTIEPLGRIVPAARADLVLLDEDPLANIHNLRSVAAVMTRGNWYSRKTLDAILACTVATTLGCGSSTSEPSSPIAGTYQTAVTLTSNDCTGITVQSNPTTISHSAGAVSFTVTHAGQTYAGTLGTNNSFTTTAKAIVAGADTHTLTIAGAFSNNGFTADVTAVVSGSQSCQYVVRWVGSR